MTAVVTILRAVMACKGLTAPARHVMHALGVRADFTTGVVPEEHSPSLSDLAEDTGLGRSTVARMLDILERSGWVDRDRPDVVKARSEGATTRYRIKIGGSPAEGLVPERDHEGSPRAGLPVVPERDGGSPAAGRINRKTPTGSTQPPTSTNQEQTPRQRAAPPRAPQHDPEAFDRFWDAYPRRVAKGDARKAWDKAVTKAPPPVIIAAAQRYRDQPGREPRYTAHPATWLNAERWTDEPPAPSPAVPAQPGMREHGGLKLAPRTADRFADNARFAAMDAAEAQPAPAAIGGSAAS